MSTNVILVCCYSAFLLAVAYGFDYMARRVSLRAQRWRTGAFRYAFFTWTAWAAAAERPGHSYSYTNV